MASDGWERVSRQNPCPICGKPDNCTASTDGRAVWCGRVAEGSARENQGGQFLHVKRDDCLGRNRTPAPSLKSRASESSVRDFSRLADEAFSHPDAAKKRGELAGALGVEPTSLDRLRVGWDTPRRSQSRWTIPERDATGTVIGIAIRRKGGGKRFFQDGKRGLTYSDDWHIGNGPILLVEGASDAAALLSMGLSVIGRPSNNAGTDLLVALVRDLPDERKLIVVGENDRKVHQTLKSAVRKRHRPDCDCCSVCWPGKYGAIRTATKLSELLCRNVGWCLTPDNAKDARDWLRMMREGGSPNEDA